MTSGPDIQIARAYDSLDGLTGAHILVDRLWPRGLSKDKLELDEWIREIAPSTELRKWFGHEPEKWDRFRERYRTELDANDEAVERCLSWCRKGPVLLLYGARDRERNQAVVLRDYLRDRLGKK